MRREIALPAGIALLIGLVVSLLVHLPAWGVLGLLARIWLLERVVASRSEPEPVIFELTPETTSTPASDESPPDPSAPPSAVPLEMPRERLRPERHRSEPPRTQRIDSPQREQPRTQPPRPPSRPLHAISQRTTDERPPETPPRFISERNNRVDEETSARIRSRTRDDPEPQAAALPSASAEDRPAEPAPEAPTDAADALESSLPGSTPRDERQLATATTTRGPPALAAAEPSPASPSAPPREAPTPEQTTAREVRRETPSSPSEPAAVAITDRWGTFVVRDPVPAAREPAPSDSAIARRSAAPGSEPHASPTETHPRAPRARGASEGPPARLTWGQFEDVYGVDHLERERRAWLEARRGGRRGPGRAERWRQFRAAIENFVPDVRPGNQTALNAAASPFADWLHRAHLRLHAEFADRFLRSLPAGGLSPFADPTLRTKLEIVVNRDGTVHRIGVVETSGLLPFDYGAFEAVLRAQPYPEPPTSILSGDGRVYLHWAFHRNERQCGTFNAEPYILPNPPSSAPLHRSPLRDEPYRRLVPRDAVPDWRLDSSAPEAADESAPRRRRNAHRGGSGAHV
ncbi:MAG: TonB C-terminal domain-containing protein [Myxococcota bacterium]|nr:TonB C-terminal domain-containing protein [Myxococcota bacterium]MDW8363024.1 TonB C-terminal domain-containing protein [Myxococcales bacterium]